VVSVDTVLHGSVEVDVPAGVQPNETLIVRGAGMPALRGRRTGDLRVVVNVVVPRHLNREQKELYEQLADSMTAHNLRTEEGVFGKLRRAFGGH
jgi:molecular chaperone DnaJ